MFPPWTGAGRDGPRQDFKREMNDWISETNNMHVNTRTHSTCKSHHKMHNTHTASASKQIWIMLQIAGTRGAIRSKMWCSSKTALKEKGEGAPLAEHMPFSTEPHGCQHVQRMQADHLGALPLATPHQREASLLESLPPAASEPEAYSTPYKGFSWSSCCSALLCSKTMAQQWSNWCSEGSRKWCSFH